MLIDVIKVLRDAGSTVRLITHRASRLMTPWT
jgi:hypothetical protein